MSMWGDDTVEVEPVQPGETVCESCTLVYWAANKTCTNCALWGEPILHLEASIALVPALA